MPRHLLYATSCACQWAPSMGALSCELGSCSAAGAAPNRKLSRKNRRKVILLLLYWSGAKHCCFHLEEKRFGGAHGACACWCQHLGRPRTRCPIVVGPRFENFGIIIALTRHGARRGTMPHAKQKSALAQQPSCTLLSQLNANSPSNRRSGHGGCCGRAPTRRDKGEGRQRFATHVSRCVARSFNLIN